MSRAVITYAVWLFSTFFVFIIQAYHLLWPADNKCDVFKMAEI